MNALSIIKKNIMLVAIAATALTACEKSENLNTDELSNELGAVAIVPSSSIAVLNSTVSTSSADSIYAMGACRRDQKKVKVAESDLMDKIKTYLNANYSGYAFKKAFSISGKTDGTIKGYVVGFLFNGKPVAIAFSANGDFVKVLELREGKDLKKPGGHHPGGHFDNRDGIQKDTLAISALPTNIKSYFTNNFANDTLKAAFTNKDGSIIVISKNKKLFATAFKADGTFIKRDEVPCKPGKEKEIAQSSLPASVSSYLSTTYPNYVFKKAFSLSENGSIKGYLVLIDANLTKYGVAFDASGNFLDAKIIR